MRLYPLIRPALFRLDPERAHGLSVDAMALAGALLPVSFALRLLIPRVQAPVDTLGLRFPNAVGVAAGYDKDGRAFRGLAALGFGHVEVGTVTPRPQAGNPRPRVFRLPEEEAVINRLGFPGDGAQAVALRLQGRRPRGLVLGVNIGKNKDTPLEDALCDYQPLVGLFAPLADYLVINVSSPNTPGLRDLQARTYLDALLTGVIAERDRQRAILHKDIPLLVKLAPDLSDAQLEEAAGAALDAGMDGIIATNTTVSRAGIGGPLAAEAGGLSGRPLGHRSLSILKGIHRLTGGRMPVISVGGIMGADDARARLDAGASLVQVYTGLVYRGPGLGREIALALRG